MNTEEPSNLLSHKPPETVLGGFVMKGFEGFFYQFETYLECVNRYFWRKKDEQAT